MPVYYDPTKTPKELILPNMKAATWLDQDRFIKPDGSGGWITDDQMIYDSALHAVQLEGNVISYDLEYPVGQYSANMGHSLDEWKQVFENRAYVAKKIRSQIPERSGVYFGMFGGCPAMDHGSEFSQTWRNKARDIMGLYQEVLRPSVDFLEPVGYQNENPEAVIRMMYFYTFMDYEQVWWMWPRRALRKGKVDPGFWKEQCTLLDDNVWSAWLFWHNKDTVEPEDIARVEELVSAVWV